MTAAIAVTGAVLGAAVPAEGNEARNGAGVTEFATGFEFDPQRRLGPIGIAFDASDRLYVSGRDDLFRFGPSGGPAPAAQLNGAPVGRLLTGLTFGTDGKLYAARYTEQTTGDVVELDPDTGAVRRVVADGVQCPTALATDPASGDLFVSTVACGQTIDRIVDPGGAAPKRVTVFAGLPVDGLTFAPDGTLYLAHDPDETGKTVSRIEGTTAPRAGQRTALATVPGADGVALARSSGGGAPPFLVVNRTDGNITKVDLPSGKLTDLVVNASRGDLIAVGDDGCLYATMTDSVLKVTNVDGSCVPSGGGTGGGGGSGGSGTAPVLGGGLVPTKTVTSLVGRAKCPASRRLRVRPRVKPTRLRVVRVYVAGKRVKTVRGRALRKPIRIAKLPARAFTVVVRAKTKAGRTVVRRARYGACGRVRLS